MTAEKINGKEIAQIVRAEVKEEIASFVQETGVTPKLSVILAGDRKDSATYVRMKERAAVEVGILFDLHRLPDSVPEAELVALVDSLSANASVHGILVQLPLPAQVRDEKALLQRIPREKDVDGFHFESIGRLAVRAPSLHAPCTPMGCMELLRRSGVELSGARAVVLGRSAVVGVPMALMLMDADATVTVCHSRSVDLPEIVRQADVVVAAVGKAEWVRGDWLKPGCAIIDVGINAVDDTTKKAGYRLVGDVCFEEAEKVAGKITPVPGGVGPMTVAMLMKAVIRAAKFIHEEKKKM